MCDKVLDRGHKLLFTLGSFFYFNTCFSSQGSQPHGAPSSDKHFFKGHTFYIFPLYLHKSHVVASVGCICDGAKWEMIDPQFPHLIIRESTDHPCVTCFGIMAFLASGTACGAVRLKQICGRGKMPEAAETENKITGRAKQVVHHLWKH